MPVGKLLVVTGPPAAGKTTVSQLIVTTYGIGVHLRADDFWSYIAAGYIDPWLPEAHDQNEVVVRAVCGAAREFCLGGLDVVLDGVLGPWFVPELVARIGPEVPIDYAVLLPGLDKVLGNLANRTGHGFTSVAAARHMYEDFRRAADGPYERHIIDNTALDPAQTADAVLAARSDGRLSTSRLRGATP